MLPRATAEFYRSQQRLTVLTIAQIRRSWARMGGSFNRSWSSKVGPQVTLMVVAAQLAAARRAKQYVADAADELDLAAEPQGEFDPTTLTGVASDGRPLDSLLYGSVVTAGQAYNQGATQNTALGSGLSWLEGVVATQIADTGRVATGVGITLRNKIGYVRMLNPPSCSRCVVLAGNWYRYNQGFDRHPGCDCVHIPSPENIAGDLRTSPSGYFGSLSESEQDRLFTQSGAQAIRDGADITQVVNARSGMATGQVFRQDITYTTSGITRRGVYGSGQTDFTIVNRGKRGYIKNYRQRNAAAPRLMPESIYELADDRAHAIQLLKKYGYIT